MQVSHPNLGSPHAMVTPWAELVVVGSRSIDELTNSTTTIDHTHHEIHEGDSYHISNQQNIANAGSFNYLIVTPNTTTFTHLFINLVSQAEAQETFFEGVAVTDSGTALSSYNRKRASTNAAGVKVFLTPTLVSSGAILQIRNWGTGKNIGDIMRSENEWILNSGTTYMINAKNNTTSDNLTTTWLNWYEHIET